jgi:hypothetical protein
VEIITEDAVFRCSHDGKVRNELSQRWVTIGGVPVMVENDPEGRSIVGCPNVGINLKPCDKTLKVQSGYSTFIRIDGNPVALSSVVGLTTGTPPGTCKYDVRDPGQFAVTATA